MFHTEWKQENFNVVGLRKRDEMVLPKQDSVNDSSLAFLQCATNSLFKVEGF